MSKATYNRITNAAIVCGIVAVLLYSHAGRYSWLVMSIAVASGVVIAVSYFVLNRHTASGDCNTESRTDTARERADDAVLEGAHRLVANVAHSEDVLLNRAVAAHQTALQRMAWVPKTYDALVVGQLLADLEKHHWDVSGNLSLRHASAMDLDLKVVLSGGTMRIVPVVTGSRHAGARVKQAASIPALRVAY